MAWQRAKAGAVNFHDGPLPERAGLNTPAWAILEERERHGITWHEIASAVDVGDIYVEHGIDIAPDETALTLNTKCFEAGVDSFDRLLTDIEQGLLVPKKQDLSRRTYYRRDKRPPAAATLDFTSTAEELSTLVRGLDFGARYSNPLAKPKIFHGSNVFTVTQLSILRGEPNVQPGLVVSAGNDGVVVGTATAPVMINAAVRRNGRETSLSSAVRPGDTLFLMSAEEKVALSDAISVVAPHESIFRGLLMTCADVLLPQVTAPESDQPADIRSVPLPALHLFERKDRFALVTAFLARLSGQAQFDIAYSSDGISEFCARHPGYFAPSVPFHVEAPSDFSVENLSAILEKSLKTLDDRSTFSIDLIERYPSLSRPQLTCGIVETQFDTTDLAIEGCALTFLSNSMHSKLLYDSARVSDKAAYALVSMFDAAATGFASQMTIGDLPLVSANERKRILYEWNQTSTEYEKQVCVHELIERQADLTPDAEAIVFQGNSLTFREMDGRANYLAGSLIARGVGPDVIVGIHLPRSLDLVVAALAVMKAGGAYVPLDPHFPADRLAFMISDSDASLLLTSSDFVSPVTLAGIDTLPIEEILKNGAVGSRLPSRAAPENLCYVIYTSGSTGMPKGVMVEHRNVVNFFAGMDERVPMSADKRNVWLAVTSLSFDISVLELFWTLARGFKVVIHDAEVRQANKRPQMVARRPNDLEFGLFYWGNDAGPGRDKYRLLLEGAKFADANGFDSIWTPERHFHAFGGPYPNPSVTGAAVAAVTQNISIRAGSCVLPLHHPARVAEEWAVVDNLSNGRVALAFASGWMPEDFVLRPENAPPHNKASLVRDVEVVRRLWRGERVDFEFGGANSVGVVTQPRPVQKELPVWLTTAGNPESYREAAKLGANVLTHLLGQSIDELTEKIAIYRKTLAETGRDPSQYKVTLMLHTLLGEDRDDVRELARAPMKEYLRSAAALIKQYAWAFPAFKKPQGVSQPMDIDLQTLAPDELDAILEFAFLRYFEDSGLFGTVDDAMARLAQVESAGVNDIACLIDFGLPDELVLERLLPLADVVRRSKIKPSEGKDFGFADEVGKHNITHLQCTPSMARMFMVADEDRAALRSIHHLLIGGEALQGPLLDELRATTTASVENMYGPTETTIWSATFTATPSTGIVPIGRPIANTQLYVLDAGLRPVLPGQSGELYIGGDGVARGYLKREELTRERFLPNPFALGQMYRTGDLARFRDDGVVEFIGRVDHQIKIRGYRIELGEIEARIGTFPGVREAVVVAREDVPGDVRLVAYLRTQRGSISEQELRAHLAKVLTDVMIPAQFITVENFPMTPNQKVDRGKLPKPGEKSSLSPENFVAPVNTLQREISEIFRAALGLEKVGMFDNFFSLGGHSLLAVQIHRQMKAKLAPQLGITDVFRFPTVAALSDHISRGSASSEALNLAADRAAARRSARLGRSLESLREDTA
jgi:natural product biosynthesis luciferase-like monooxygenase protein